jgi:hypothetical protein
MRDPPLLADGLASLSGNGIKKRANVPRLAVWLVCLCLLGLGGWSVVQILLPAFDGGTKLRIVHVFLADLNGDDNQDAFLVTNQMHRIVFNDGTGNFTSNRELFMQNYALSLGDLNGDGRLEAILVNFGEGEMKLECADMPSDVIFPARSEGAPSQVFAIRDANRDGLPEGYIAGCCGGGTIMHNYATLFSNHRSCMESEHPLAAALGDLNGDGMLDVFIVKGWTPEARTSPNEVWFNDGMGNFADSGQRLGNSEGYAVALGDLDGDGFLDAVVGNRRGGEIWFNDGHGNFSVSKQRMGRGITNTIFVTDLDGDGDLDLFLGGNTSGRIWQNDGDGHFTAGQRITYDDHDAVAVGDVTGDGVADIFVAGTDSYQVWRGDGNGHFSADNRSAYR